MKFPSKTSKRPTVHLTALIDIVFLLLIFFLLASSFVSEQGIKIALPEVSNLSRDILPDATVKIDMNGKFYYQGFEVNDETLFELLNEHFKDFTNHRVAIRADRRVEYDKVVQVIDIAKSAGARDFLLVNEQTE